MEWSNVVFFSRSNNNCSFCRPIRFEIGFIFVLPKTGVTEKHGLLTIQQLPIKQNVVSIVNEPTSFDVPNANTLVKGAWRDDVGLRVESAAEYVTVVALQRLHAFTRTEIPHLQSFIIWRCAKQPRVRTPTNIRDACKKKKIKIIEVSGTQIKRFQVMKKLYETCKF